MLNSFTGSTANKLGATPVADRPPNIRDSEISSQLQFQRDQLHSLTEDLKLLCERLEPITRAIPSPQVQRDIPVADCDLGKAIAESTQYVLSARNIIDHLLAALAV